LIDVDAVAKKREERLTADLFIASSKSVNEFYSETVALGRPIREKYPKWHPMSRPKAEFTEVINGIRGATSLEQGSIKFLEPPPPRPSSAAGRLEKCRQQFSDSAAERITGAYASVNIKHSGTVPQPGVANPKALGTNNSWTPGRFINWISATHNRRGYWPVQKVGKNSDVYEQS